MTACIKSNADTNSIVRFRSPKTTEKILNVIKKKMENALKLT